MLAAALAVSACGARGGYVPRPFPDVRPAADAGTRPVDPSSVIATALSLRGAPYAWGGATPKGFDCSGFTHYVYAQHGVSIPPGRRAPVPCRRLRRLAKPETGGPGLLQHHRTGPLARRPGDRRRPVRPCAERARGGPCRAAQRPLLATPLPRRPAHGFRPILIAAARHNGAAGRPAHAAPGYPGCAILMTSPGNGCSFTG